MLEAMTAFVAAKKLVRETHVAAHAANRWKIHHCFRRAPKIERREKENLEGRKERENAPRKPKSTRTQRKRENMITTRREKLQVEEEEEEGRERIRDMKSL